MKTTYFYLVVLLAAFTGLRAVDASEPGKPLPDIKPLPGSIGPEILQLRAEQSLQSLFSTQQVRVSYDRLPSQSQPQGWATRVAFRSVRSDWGGEAAGRLNAEAMRRYRERWERHLNAPRSVPVPSLYPSKVEEILERVKGVTSP